MVAKRAKFTPKKSADGWMINVPARYSPSGKRERHFFKTRALADGAAQRMREQRDTFGDQAKGISPSLAEDAQAARLLLDPHGLSILDAARIAVEAVTARNRSREAGEAFELFAATKEGRSQRQQKAYDLARRQFTEDFGGRNLASITAAELLDHVDGRCGGPTTFNHRSGLLKAFWRWAAKDVRGWCDAAVADVLELRETAKREVGLLTFEQCRKLMSIAEDHPETALGFALLLFAGIRRAELERLSLADIREDGIVVPATSAKIGRRRFIELSPALRAWVEAYPPESTVLPANWNRREKMVRRLAGWRVWTDLLDPPAPPENLPEWPPNALRHTHATVSLAAGCPIERLIFEFGHSGGTATLKAHYAGAMSKREALKILSIGPAGTKIPIIEMA